MIARTSEDAAMPRTPLVALAALMLPVSLIADVLVLRNGTRVQGELMTVRNGVIEFVEQRSGGRGRVLRFDREEVVRIELDRNGGGGGGEWPSGVGGNSGGRPPGMRERLVNVGASVPWNDTSIDVRSGQTLYFSASGEVRWGRDRRDGPEGEDNSPYNAGRPMPNRPGASLIGRIGESNDPFFIGRSDGGIRARSSGRLYLGINDEVLTDNSGTFRVIVYY
jgi:hypothetical protein